MSEIEISLRCEATAVDQYGDMMRCDAWAGHEGMHEQHTATGMIALRWRSK